MTKDLDLDNWEKKHIASLDHKEKKKRKANLSQPQAEPFTQIPKNIRSLIEEAMGGDEIAHIITSPQNGRKNISFLFVLPFLIVCVFFVFTIINMAISEEQPFLFLFLFFPFFIFSRLWKTTEKRYFVFGKKSFYYSSLMDRPILYSEIENVDYKSIRLKTTNKQSKAFDHRHVLCFSFYAEIHEGIAEEAKYFRNKRNGDETLHNFKNLVIYPHHFNHNEIINELSQRIKNNI